MKKQQGGDASFLIGLVLGIAIGAAVALVLTPNSGEENRAKIKGAVGEAKDSLQSKAEDAKARVTGASEGAAQ
jgi:gas vesicle protein